MLTPREKSPLPEKISPEEALTHDTASSRAESPTHYQQVILAVLHQAGQRAQHTTNKLFWPSCIKQGREPNTLPTSYFGRPASSRAESPTHYQQVILAVLHQAGQRAQHTTNKLFWPSCIKQGREPNTLPTSYFGRPETQLFEVSES